MKDKQHALADALLRSAPIGLGFLDPEFRFVYANESLAALVGLPLEGLVGRTLMEAVPDMAEAFVAVLQGILDERRPESGLEFAVEGTPRRHLLCSFFPVEVARSSLPGVGIAVLDITARKLEEERVAFSERRFRSLAEATAEVVWVADGEGRALYDGLVSWSAFTGQPRHEAVGFGWSKCLHPDDRPRALHDWEEQTIRKVPQILEYRVRRADGMYRNVETRCAPIFDADGSLREWVGMNLDITERKAGEAERARLFDEAQQAIRARDDFLSIASHELKTPLTPLATRLQMLRRRVAAREALEPDDIQRPLDSLVRLTELINDLLDTSRVRANRLVLHLEPVSLSRIVRDGVARLVASTTQHRITLEEPDHETWVNGDPSRLQQVIDNLLDNAVKYSPQGGRVKVALGEMGENVMVSVADEGIGIPKEQQPRLFDRFFRATDVSTRGFGGLGLGLYISRDIVEQHGGKILLESEPGRGSTFYVQLPRIAAPALFDHRDPAT